MYNFTEDVTYHSFLRAKERCNLKSFKAIERNIRRAYERGKRADSFSSWEHSYLMREKYEGVVPVAYNDRCYLFNGVGQCVTILRLPEWFGKKKHFDGKVRIRNYKKYCADRQAYAEDMEYAC